MTTDPEPRPAGRARRARQPVPRAVVQKVKLTDEEQRLLRARAAALGVSVPRLMVEAALADHGGETATERRERIAELFETRRLLATIANNVNQLAHQANINGEIGPEQKLEGALADVEKVIADLRRETGVRR